MVGRSERTCDENASTCTQASRRPPVRIRTSCIAGIAEPTHPLAAGHTRRSGSAGSARGLSNRNRDRSTSRQLRSQPANHPRYTARDPSTAFFYGLGTESDQGAEFCRHDTTSEAGGGNPLRSTTTIVKSLADRQPARRRASKRSVRCPRLNPRCSHFAPTLPDSREPQRNLRHLRGRNGTESPDFTDYSEAWALQKNLTL